MSTLHLNPYFTIPPDVKGQYESLHVGELPMVYVYRDVRYLKLEWMSSKDVQEIITIAVDGIAGVVIGMLKQREQCGKESGKVEIDASPFIKSQIQKRIKKFEDLSAAANSKGRKFYCRQIQLLREFEPFFQTFFEKHAVFLSDNTESDVKTWKKDVISQLYKTVFYDDPPMMRRENGIPIEFFSNIRKQRIEMYEDFKKKEFRSVQHPNTKDKVLYAAGKSTLEGVMQENGKIQSELGEHELFDIPLEYGREAIFFRKSRAMLV